MTTASLPTSRMAHRGRAVLAAPGKGFTLLPLPGIAIVALWVLWLVSWILAAVWTNRTEEQAGAGVALRYRAPSVLGAAMLFVPAHGYEGALRLWHVGWIGAWICVGAVALGIAFAWWARLHLGRLWSASITHKADHRVVDSGPYALVRHPIYSGLLLALGATAAAKGTILGLAGFGFLLLGILIKARSEEGWLAVRLNANAYSEYRSRVPMLVPGWPRSR